MSDTIHLACVTCRVELWVGQVGFGSRAYLYEGEEYRAKFFDFYLEHGRHDVRLTNLEGLDALPLPTGQQWTDWVEFGEEPEPAEPAAEARPNKPPKAIFEINFPESWASPSIAGMKVGDKVTVRDYPEKGDNRFTVTGRVLPR